MTLNSLKNELEKLNIPIAYSHFKDVQYPPFCTYSVNNEDNVTADGKTAITVFSTRVDLCTEHRNFTLENELEVIFAQNSITFEKTILWIDSEKMFQITYDFEMEG